MRGGYRRAKRVENIDRDSEIERERRERDIDRVERYISSAEIAIDSIYDEKESR